MSATAHVICQNDSVEAVVIGSEEFARAETQRLKQEYLKRHPWFTEDEIRAGYWHHHTVEVIKQGAEMVSSSAQVGNQG